MNLGLEDLRSAKVCFWYLQFFSPALLRFSASPLLRFSASPLLRFSASPLLRFSASPLLRFSLRATPCSHGKIWLSWRTAEEGESRESRVSWISHSASRQLQVPVISNDFQTIFKQMEHDGTWWNQYSKYSKYSNLTMTHTAAQSISLPLRVWVSCDPWSSLTGGRRQRELQQLRGGRQEAHSAQFNWCGPMWPNVAHESWIAMNRNECNEWTQIYQRSVRKRYVALIGPRQ